jgi:hypothetical protein
MEDTVIELSDSTEYVNELQALEEIKKILAHPGLRNPESLKRRLWLYLNMNISPKL